MAGNAALKRSSGRPHHKCKKKKEECSSGVTNAHTLCRLIEPMDAAPSSRIHIKHEKELLTAHLLKREQKCHTLPVMFDEFWVDTFIFLKITAGETSRFSSAAEGGLVCRSPFKVPTNIYANVVFL